VADAALSAAITSSKPQNASDAPLAHKGFSHGMPTTHIAFRAKSPAKQGSPQKTLTGHLKKREATGVAFAADDLAGRSRQSHWTAQKLDSELETPQILVRGGPGRIRTSNQTVMSAVTLSETSIKSDPFHHTNQQMFTIGCGQSLAKHWSGPSQPNPNRPSGDALAVRDFGLPEALELRRRAVLWASGMMTITMCLRVVVGPAACISGRGSFPGAATNR
jgi:hypothetical protein